MAISSVLIHILAILLLSVGVADHLKNKDYFAAIALAIVIVMLGAGIL